MNAFRCSLFSFTFTASTNDGVRILPLSGLTYKWNLINHIMCLSRFIARILQFKNKTPLRASLCEIAQKAFFADIIHQQAAHSHKSPTNNKRRPGVCVYLWEYLYLSPAIWKMCLKLSRAKESQHFYLLLLRWLARRKKIFFFFSKL